jgi:hypothetical protein
MSRLLKPKMSDGAFVLIAVVGCLAAFAILLAAVSAAAVRHVLIFLQEKTQDTIAFRNVDGQVKVVGIKGITGENPTLLMRTGDFALELTVINDDDRVHMLYIDGVNAHTKVLSQGDSDVITLYSKGEATYNYYDWGSGNGPLGQIKAVKVTAYE